MYRAILLGLFLFSSLTGFPFDEERILSFQSDITIHTDASMTVSETITVFSQGISIRRGIEREFPTSYRDSMGNNYSVRFDVQQVLHNSAPAHYSIQDRINGKVVRIGQKNRTISSGEHRYKIVYKTTRQLGFFDKHDELYWNVTGSGWRLPIDKVVARVQLPLPKNMDGPPTKLGHDGYTGYAGSREKDYDVQLIGERRLAYFTTRKLNAHEGFSLVMTFPKGIVRQPTIWQKIYYFFADNWMLCLLFIFFILLLIFFIIEWRRVALNREKQTIIPLFHPPKNMSPGQVRYVIKKGYDSTVLTADMVDMAVQGIITIKHHRGRWGSQQYTLTKIKDIALLRHPHQHDIARSLFATSDEIMLVKKNRKILQPIIDAVEQNFNLTLKSFYFLLNKRYVFLGIVSTFLFLATIFYFVHTILFSPLRLFFVIAVSIMFPLIQKVTYLAYTYTPQGQKIFNEIEGFKMFLSATEEERIKIVGTPPYKSPQLYEKYLPYAIALDVDLQWAAQFREVFAKLEDEGRPYVPAWYFGHAFRGFNPSLFSSSMTTSFNNAIASSVKVPGSFSGSGGRGSSGGGGGGGGGGGW